MDKSIPTTSAHLTKNPSLNLAVINWTGSFASEYRRRRFCTDMFSALAHTFFSVRLNSSLDACRYRIRVCSGMLQGISCILSFLPIPLHFRYFHWVHRKAVLNGGCMGGRGSQEPNVRVSIYVVSIGCFPSMATNV
jgi:hypothetical protein